MNFYVHQHKHYGIGNFINCTPTIQMLSHHFKQKIPVLFDSDVVRDMFLDCEFIDIITHSKGKKQLFHSGLVNWNIPDHIYIQQKISSQLKIKSSKKYHTYVDTVQLREKCHSKPYVVFARGCAGKYWEKAKEPGDDIYIHIAKKVLDQGLDVIFIGSDLERDKLLRIHNALDQKSHMVLNNIRHSLALLNECKYLVANDTGMYHAAGALNVPTFVLWKDTPFEKNKCPGTKTVYSQKNDWEKDYDLYHSR